jgi:hypothetical protein
MQADTPVRADESDEVRALRRLAGIAGWCVSSTTGGTHSPTSLHYAVATNGRGRAVDLVDRRGPSTSSEWLLAINEQIVQLLPLSMISELIYGGPGAFCVKNGVRVDGRIVYSSVIDNHRNHIHLAVVRGFVYNGGTPVPDDPTIPNIRGPVELHIVADANGHATGYYIFSPTTGEIHAWGEGAKYYGRSEVVT